MRMSTLRSIMLIIVVLLAAPFYCPAEGASDKAPEFVLIDLQGVQHRLSDYRGKVVLINFWASWCPECIEEMPSLNTLYERYRQRGLVVLGVSADRKQGPVMNVLSRTPVSYPVLLDTTGGVFIKNYTVVGLPTTVVINKNGVIEERLIGRTDFSSPAFIKKIEGLIGGKQ